MYSPGRDIDSKIYTYLLKAVGVPYMCMLSDCKWSQLFQLKIEAAQANLQNVWTVLCVF